MTETATDVEGSVVTNAHEQLVEEVLRIFDAVPSEAGDEYYLPYRNALEAALKGLSPLELAAQLGTVREALEGLSSITESAGVVMNMVHRDAWERVIRAHERALRAAGIE